MPYKRKTTSTCAVYSCNNNFRFQDPKGVSYYSMPKDKERLKKWLAATGRRDLEEMSNFEEPRYFRKYYVCSDHFELNCFKNSKCLKRGLTSESIPTLKLGNVPDVKKLDGPSLSGSMSYRNCEICGKGCCKSEKFMAKFPSDENRCKQWVKAIGNENLVHVPIEKLHKLHYVCTMHFVPGDYELNEYQLRDDAVPSLYLNAAPLPDYMLVNFPCRLIKEEPSSCIDYCEEEQTGTHCDSVVIEPLCEQDGSQLTKVGKFVKENQDQSTNYESSSSQSHLSAQNESFQSIDGKSVKQEQDYFGFEQINDFVTSDIKVEWDEPEMTESEFVSLNEPLIKSETVSTYELTIENETLSTNESTFENVTISTNQPMIKTETVSKDKPTFEQITISTNKPMIKTEIISTDEPTFEKIFVSETAFNEHIIKKEKDDLADPDYVDTDLSDNQSNDDDDYDFTSNELGEVVNKKKSKDIVVRLNNLVQKGDWSLQQLSDQVASRLYREERMSNSFKAAKFKCELCVTIFSTRDKFFKHIDLHNESVTRKVQCQICKKYLNQRYIYRHLVVHKTRYKCKKCPYVCYKYFQTKRHTNIHKDLERDGHYICEYCKERLESSTAVYEHLKKQCHIQYSCCEKFFPTRRGLFHHIRRVHNQPLEQIQSLERALNAHQADKDRNVVISPLMSVMTRNSPDGEQLKEDHQQLLLAQTSTSSKVIQQPTVIQPIVIQPTLIQPTVTQPTITQPTVIQPTVIQPTLIQPIPTQPTVRKPTVRYKKDSATLQREYRQRQTPEEARRRKTATAAYMREYRARKKQKNVSDAMLQPAKEIGLDGENAINQKLTNPIATAEHNEKLNYKRALGARRAKDYRIRQRNKRAVTIQSTSNDEQTQDEEPPLTILGF